MKLRNVPHWTAPGVLIAALLIAGPPSAAVPGTARGPGIDGGTVRGHAVAAGRASKLPACPPGGRSTHRPTAPAGPDTPGACRAEGPILESGLQLTRPVQAGFTPAGYHHLGANTSGEWSGVSGRISVVTGSVRPRSYDFVASRFMVKRDLGRGNIAWLEAGWAQTGWAGAGTPHIYTFNTNTHAWQFYDQYALRPGDRVWLDIHSDIDGVWGAWLWWNNRWNLLTAQKLPIGAAAYVEQYVEVHVDDSRPTRVDVPPVTVDNVQLKPVGGGGPRFWRSDVPTLTGTGPGERQRSGGFCLTWLNPYDTWTAGDCGDDDSGGLLITRPAPPLPSGEAEVVHPSTAPPESAGPAPAAPTPDQTTPSTPAPTEAPATVPTPVQPPRRRSGLLSHLLG